MINPEYILDIIQQMLAENRAAMKRYDIPRDYLDGMNNGLKELAMELEIATWEDLRDA